MRVPTSVRFDEPTEIRLDEISRKSGLTKADLVRRAVVEYVAQVDRDGKLTISLHENPVSYKIKRKPQ